MIFIGSSNAHGLKRKVASFFNKIIINHPYLLFDLQK